MTEIIRNSGAKTYFDVLRLKNTGKEVELSKVFSSAPRKFHTLTTRRIADIALEQHGKETQYPPFQYWIFPLKSPIYSYENLVEFWQNRI